jgi:hypothetical protein
MFSRLFAVFIVGTYLLLEIAILFLLPLKLDPELLELLKKSLSSIAKMVLLRSADAK